MTLRPHLSIRTRLILLVVSATLLASAFLVGVTVWRETESYGQSRRDALLNAAHAIAAAAGVPVADQNSVAASQATWAGSTTTPATATCTSPGTGLVTALR